MFRFVLLLAAGLPLAAAAQDLEFPATGYLELDGAYAANVLAASGGAPTAEVANEQMGVDGVVRKHIGALRFEPLTLVVSPRLTPVLGSWIQSSLDRSYARKNGAVVYTDGRGNITARHEFSYALITGIEFPEFNAATREPAYLEVTLTPEFTRYVAAAGRAPAQVRQRRLRSELRVEVAGLDTSGLVHAEAFRLVQTLVDSVGDGRDYEKTPGALQVPPLKLSVAESTAAPYFTYAQSFLIAGNNGPDQEKTGAIVFLEDGRELARFTLAGIGVTRVAPEASAGSRGRTVRADFYVEDVRLPSFAAQ